MKQVLLLFTFLSYLSVMADTGTVLNKTLPGKIAVRIFLPEDTILNDTIPAEFPGGVIAQWEYINKHIKYPRLAKEKGHQGEVLVMYDVETDGSVTNVRVFKGVEGAPELEEEAVRVVRTFPKHKPATYNGQSIRYTMFAAVKYSMQ
jgi:TonB family protein